MVSLSAIKPLLPFLLTFLVPRGISYYRAIKTAIKTRPPTRPLPAKTSRGLNILFLSICLFLFASFPSQSPSYQPNIFEITNSRLHIPTDVLFDRLALIRPLTPFDETLKDKITTPITRTLYLRFGPHTLQTCPFCHPSSPTTYLLHHLPVNVLLPHLLHLFLLGLATSNPIAGRQANTYRTRFALSALGLAALDIYLTSMYSPSSSLNPNSTAPPRGAYWTSLTLRPLSVCLLDALLAATIYVSATNRLPFLFPSSGGGGGAEDREAEKQRQLHALTRSCVTLQTALTKLRAYGVARSAVVRNGRLKGRDDEYWRVVVGMEGPTASRDGEAGSVGSVWDEDEVMEALARVTSGGEVDVQKVSREAASFVESVTRGLEMEGNS